MLSRVPQPPEAISRLDWDALRAATHRPTAAATSPEAKLVHRSIRRQQVGTKRALQKWWEVARQGAPGDKLSHDGFRKFHALLSAALCEPREPPTEAACAIEWATAAAGEVSEEVAASGLVLAGASPAAAGGLSRGAFEAWAYEVLESWCSDAVADFADELLEAVAEAAPSLRLRAAAEVEWGGYLPADEAPTWAQARRLVFAARNWRRPRPPTRAQLAQIANGELAVPPAPPGSEPFPTPARILATSHFLCEMGDDKIETILTEAGMA